MVQEEFIMSLKEKIYKLSPLFIQNFMISIAGYLKNRNRYGKIYYNHRLFLREFDKYSLDEKLKYQETELIKFIKYSYKNSNFYKKLYEGIDIENIKSIEDLKKLPYVDKEMLRSNIEDVFTIKKSDAVVGHTGGTTGKSLVV